MGLGCLGLMGACMHAVPSTGSLVGLQKKKDGIYTVYDGKQGGEAL